MAITGSGQISVGDIRSEFQQTGRNDYSFSYQMDPTWAHGANTGYTPVNEKSPSKPSSTDPDSISEWYSYNHSYNWPCSGSSVSLDVSSCRRKFYRVGITGAVGYSAIISVYGDLNSSIYSYRIYDTYPFTSTGAFIASAALFSGNMSTTTTNHTYTMSASTATIYFVAYENDCL